MESFVLMLFIARKSPFSSSSVIAAHWHASAHIVGTSPWGSPCVSFVLLLFFLIYWVKSFLFRANRYNLFLCLGTPSDRLFLASSAARARRGYGVPVRKYPSRSRKIEHSVSPVAGFRRRVEYIGIHFKQVKRFRMARNWFAGQFFVKTCFS